MTTSEERFQKGLEMRARLGGEGQLFKGAVPTAYELSPDMYRIFTEFLYGSVWSRPGLDIRYRVIATMTAAAAQMAQPQVRTQLNNALNVGLTPDEVVEVLIQCALYSGIPASHNALGIAKEVFDERGIRYIPAQIFDASEEPGSLYDRGVAKHRALNPDVFGYYSVQPTDEEHELDLLMNEYLWGAIWTRPGLDTKSRIVCALTAQVVQGQFDLFIRRMIEGALRNGFYQRGSDGDFYAPGILRRDASREGSHEHRQCGFQVARVL